MLSQRIHFSISFLPLLSSLIATLHSDIMQDLVDRLVVVVEEQDVLFTLVVLQEMKETGCLEQAINAVRKSYPTAP